MAISFLELVTEALVTYWSSPLPFGVLLACGTAMGTLIYVFLTNARNPKLRVSLLTGLYALSIFFWVFIGVSFFLCVGLARMVAYASSGVPLAVFGAVIAGLSAAAIVSAAVWRYGSAGILRRFAPRELNAEERWIQRYVDLLAEFLGPRAVQVRVVESDDAMAMAVGGRERTILLSRGSFKLLDRDELESVAAHELMHHEHHDAEFKVFSRVFSRILFFDPFSKLFDPAIHREREYLADEASGRITGKPASLASALIKLAGRPAPASVSYGLSIYSPGHGVFSRYPPILERVKRLLLLSELLRAGAVHDNRS